MKLFKVGCIKLTIGGESRVLGNSNLKEYVFGNTYSLGKELWEKELSFLHRFAV